MESARTFYFNEAEWRRLFPKRVVDWMVDRSRVALSKGDRTAPADGYHLFPDADDLPVVVAARMSLSFPLLISAVPLYRVDYALSEKDQVLERVWFSDGGICSNFPVHFFDAPLPSRPTLAISLSQFHRAHPRDSTDERKNVWMVKTNSSGVLPNWNRFDSDVVDGKLTHRPSPLGFLSAIMATMQNWVDASQMHVPGIRDRIAHVRLDERVEGGLNLTMPPEIIDRLSTRGYFAGVELRQRFADDASNPDVMNWRNHRWVRLRSTLAATQEWLTDFSERFGATSTHATFADLLSGKAGDPPSYQFPKSYTATELMSAVDRLTRAIADWKDQDKVDFTADPPNPRPAIRLTPEL